MLVQWSIRSDSISRAVKSGHRTIAYCDCSQGGELTEVWRTRSWRSSKPPEYSGPTSSSSHKKFSIPLSAPAAYSSTCTGRERSVSLPSGTLIRISFSSAAPAGGGCTVRSLSERRRLADRPDRIEPRLRNADQRSIPPARHFHWHSRSWRRGSSLVIMGGASNWFASVAMKPMILKGRRSCDTDSCVFSVVCCSLPRG